MVAEACGREIGGCCAVNGALKGAGVSTQVCVCGAVSRCLVGLVLSFVAARVSHVIPVAPVVLYGFR